MKPFGGGNLLSRSSECLAYSLQRDYAAAVAVGMQSVLEVEANVFYAENGYFLPAHAERLSHTKRRLLIEMCIRDSADGVQLAHDRGAEFIPAAERAQKIDAFADRSHIVNRSADGFGVSVRRVFDVHGDGIDQPPGDQLFEPRRQTSVGVELDGIAELLDAAQKRFQPLLQQRFAAGYADAVENARPLAEKSQNLVCGNRGRRADRRNAGPVRKGGVVAERTGKVTAVGEHGAGDFARIVEQGELLQPADCLLYTSNCMAQRVCATVCKFDVNGLKMVNDTYGHLAGDRLLTEIAAAFKSALHTGEYLIRLSGDEFLAVLFSCDEQQAEARVQTVLTGLQKLNLYPDAHRNEEFCYGLFVVDGETELSVNEVLSAVDEKLYMPVSYTHLEKHRKERRKNIIHFFIFFSRFFPVFPFKKAANVLYLLFHSFSLTFFA